MTGQLYYVEMFRTWLTRDPLVWLRPLVVAGILLLSAALALKASPRQMVLLTGLLVVAGIVPLFVAWPSFGIVALIFTTMVVPSPSLPGGINVSVLLLVLLLGLWVLNMIATRRLRLVRSSTVWPLLAFLIGAGLSFGVGQLPWFGYVQQAPLSAQIGGLLIFIFSIAAFLMVADQIRDLRWLATMVWLFLALGATHVAGWVVPGIGSFTERVVQEGVHNNSIMWTWLVALAFGQAFYNRDLHLGWRLVLGAIVAVTLYVGVILNSDWKAGYLPPLASIGVVLALRSWRLGLLMAMAAPFPVWYLSSQAVATDEYSYSTRVDAWLIVLRMLKTNPILGFGPANYYYYTPLFRIRGYNVKFNSHNQYIDIVAQTGLLGLICFMWFFWEIGWLGWRLLKKVPAGGFAEAYVYGVLGGVVGTLVAAALVDWVLPFVYNIGFLGFRGSVLLWLFLGGLVSIEQLVKRQERS